jgi:tetratricopeptide (TPR) repeat protein
MELQDTEKLQLLESLGPKLARPSVRKLAERVVDSIADESARFHARELLAGYFVEVWEFQAAEALAPQLTKRAQVLLLVRMASKRAAEAPAAALMYLKRAEEAATFESDSYDRSAVQSQIAGVYVELKQFDRARQIAGQISVVFDRIFALTLLARAQGMQGNKPLALELLAEAFDLFDRVEPQEPEQGWLLDDIGQIYLDLGYSDSAGKAWRRAVSTAHRSHDSSKLLLRICRACLSLGDGVFAREVALMISHPAQRAEALAMTRAA